ncbi:MAG: sigma-70 family RNA polymerase sigma factor [Nitrospinae bacterium]|nr:sigma-70 family RNA polymerase sigma factor [Nitrospinota bacterium]MBI3813599.1 sigma-70 family RNA polymerase sigma factor [Nitrospinota bacterium]
MEDEKRQDFEDIAIPHFNAVYNFAYRMTGNKADAEDIVQDVFLSAYRFFHRFQEGTNCKAWLFKILKNTFINSLKKKNREADYLRGQGARGKGQGLNSSTHQLINSSTALDEGFDESIQNALNKLPEDFRMAIILCDIEGLSYQEIAEIQECPIGTVRSRINRARRFLAKEIIKFSHE